MSAPKQITKEKIIEAAVSLVRVQGMAALNARSLAKALGCSTRPVYISFGGMDEVKSAVVERITAEYQRYLKSEVESGRYPPYKAYGMGYIRFAREQKHFFLYLFMRNREGEEPVEDGGNIESVIDALTASTGLDRESARLFHLESWIFVHGIASMLATGYLDLEEDFIEKLLTDSFMGLKVRFGEKMRG